MHVLEILRIWMRPCAMTWQASTIMDSTLAALSRLNDRLDHPTIGKLGEAFSRAGFELAIVGGTVRDAILGRQGHDFDFTTNATPDQTLAVLKTLSRSHWETGRAFGTIGAQIDGLSVEVTTYRSDVYEQDTRKPHVAFGTSLDDDLARRDFAANAIAVRLPERVVVDPYGGVQDIVAGVLRTPGDPAVSFDDDPLRMMRAARFVSQLEWSLDPAAQRAIVERADRIGIVSAERVSAELEKLMLGAHPAAGLEVLVDTGLAAHILPELPALRLEHDSQHHHKDVYRHSLTVLSQAIELEHERGMEPDLILRLAALLHDIGKPATRKFGPGGEVTFRQHDVVGAKMAKRRLKAMRFDGHTIKAVARLVELHMRFYGYGEAGWTDSAVRRYVRDAGDLLPRLHILTRSDVTTRNRRKAERLEFAYDDLENRIAELATQEQLDAVRPELNGEQIMAELGISPSPVVGAAYRYLLEVRLEEGPIGIAAATDRLHKWYEAYLEEHPQAALEAPVSRQASSK